MLIIKHIQKSQYFYVKMLKIAEFCLHLYDIPKINHLIGKIFYAIQLEKNKNKNKNKKKTCMWFLVHYASLTLQSCWPLWSKKDHTNFSIIQIPQQPDKDAVP